MYFDIDIPVAVCVMFGTLFFLTLLIVILYRSRLMLPVKCRVAAGDTDATVASTTLTPVSIVVYARDNSSRLELLLDDLLSQDYPAGYEIIVVNDSGGYACNDVVTRKAMQHHNIRMTFVPEQAHNLSRKKLAITLGLKSAHNEYVLLLSAECRVPSQKWLVGMVSYPESMVLGQAVIKGDDGIELPFMMRLDEAETAITWIGAAERRRAFRGNGYNIGYSRSIFFDNGGFSGTLNLHAGDDDLFVNKVAGSADVKAVLSDDTIVMVTSSRPQELYQELKVSHMFTGRQLPSHPVMKLAPVVMWFSVVIAFVASWFGFPNMMVLSIAVVLLFVQWLIIGLAWSKASRAVGIPLGGFKTVLSLFMLPVYNMRYRFIARNNQYQHYTWQNKKSK